MFVSKFCRVGLRCNWVFGEGLRSLGGGNVDPDVFGNWQKEKKEKMKVFSNEFGALAKEKGLVEFNEDKFEKDEIEFVPDEFKRLKHPDQYVPIIKNLISKGKIQESLNVLTTRMLKEDRVKPNKLVYNTLLGTLGRIGHVDMCFQLYKQMKERGLQPDGATYTSLFNACANCSSSEKGLSNAKYLRQKMKEKGWISNTTNYNAMIKAFGKCGDLATAFELADEMIAEEHFVSARTMNFLLMACASDRKNGFIHAIKLWHKFFRGRRLLPDIYTYNLLLRIVRDCEANNIENDKIKDSKNQNENTPNNSNDSSSTMLTIKDFNQDLVNRMDTPVSLNLPSERLCLLGNAVGFVKHMITNKVKPDVKTLTLLLEIIPSDLEREDELLQIMKENKIKPDIDFFNILIKKRNFRNDFDNARETLNLIQEHNLYPDIVTFGVMAIGCSTVEEMRRFLKDMELAGFRANIEIIGKFVREGCLKGNWKFVEELLRRMKREEIDADELLISGIEKGIAKTREKIVLAEKGVQVPGKYNQEWFKQEFQHFLIYYKQWLSTTKMKLTEQDIINSIVQ